MNTYEVVIITKTGMDQKETDSLVTKVVEGIGGTVDSTDPWGDRKFSYPIQGHVIGSYCTYMVSCEANKSAELKRLLGFEEEILRSMVLTKKD